MRKHWMDNLRWVTVLLVLFYHVIYFYNNKGAACGRPRIFASWRMHQSS